MSKFLYCAKRKATQKGGFDAWLTVLSAVISIYPFPRFPRLFYLQEWFLFDLQKLFRKEGYKEFYFRFSSFVISIKLAFDHAVVEFASFVRFAAEELLEVLGRTDDGVAPAPLSREDLAHGAVDRLCLFYLHQAFAIGRVAEDGAAVGLLFEVFEVPHFKGDAVFDSGSLRVFLREGFREAVEYSPKPNVKKQVIYFIGFTLNESTLHPQEEEVSELQWMEIHAAYEAVTFRNDKNLIAKAMDFIDRRGM